MALNAKTKGASGEREFGKWLLDNFKLLSEHGIVPERNLLQTREGGADIINVPCFIFEIKRVEKLDLQSAWNQVQRVKSHKIKVVAFRMNRKPWNFLISANHIDVDKGFLILNEMVFKKYASKIFETYFQEK